MTKVLTLKAFGFIHRQRRRSNLDHIAKLEQGWIGHLPLIGIVILGRWPTTMSCGGLHDHSSNLVTCAYAFKGGRYSPALVSVQHMRFE